MINYKDDKSYISEYDQQEEIESVNFNDINLKLYHALYHINEDGYSLPLFVNDQTSKYFNVNFYEISINDDLKD